MDTIMTTNKVQHFQEWLVAFKKKPVIVPVSKLPKVEDYENKSVVYQFTDKSVKAQSAIVDWRFKVVKN